MRLVLSVVAFSLFVLGEASSQDTHPFSLDDYLKLERVGSGLNGDEIYYWQQSPPYEDMAYYGHGFGGAWGGGHQLHALNLGSSGAVVQRIGTELGGQSYWLDSVSPDGRFLAFYYAIDADMRFGLYEAETGDVQSFDVAPVVNEIFGHQSVWVSNHELVLSVHADDFQPVNVARPFTTTRLLEESENAWRGGVSATVAVSHRGEEVIDDGALLRIDAASGEVRSLAPGRYESLTASADGRFIAGLRVSFGGGDIARGLIGGIYTYDLVIYDVRNDRLSVLFEGERNVVPGTLNWARQSNTLVFYSFAADSDITVGEYWAFPAETEQIVRFPHFGLDLASNRERGFSQRPERAHWMDGELAVYARRHTDNSAVFTPRNFGASLEQELGEKDWYIVSRDGATRNATEGLQDVSAIAIARSDSLLTVLAGGELWDIQSEFESDPILLSEDIEGRLRYPSQIIHRPYANLPRDVIPLQAISETSRSAVLFNIEDAALVSVPFPAENARFRSGSFTSRTALFYQVTESGGELTLVNESGEERPVSTLNAHLRDVSYSQWRPISYDIEIGDEEHRVSGCYLLPADYQPDQQYPVIVDIYPNVAGCGSNQVTRFDSHATGHLFASAGFIYFRPNTLRRYYADPLEPLQSLPALVDQGVEALVEQGVADSNRVALYGISQGSVAALYVAAHSEHYGAVIVSHGWADLMSHYFESSFVQMFYEDVYPFSGSAPRYNNTHGSDFNLGTTPFENVDAYLENSPLFLADQIDTPTLLLHSDRDNFSVRQYEMMFVALKQNDVPSRLVRYWGEGHGPSSPGNMRHYWDEILAWTDEHLEARSPRQHAQ